MSVRYRVVKSGKDERIHLAEMRQYKYKTAKEFIALGELTRDTMHSTIDANLHRPSTGNLKSQIQLDVHSFGDTVSWGVGNIALLNAEAPYWEFADKGGIVPPTTMGYFGNGEAPDPSQRGVGSQSFSQGGGFLVSPKTPTRPLNFVASTIFWFEHTVNNLNVLFRR